MRIYCDESRCDGTLRRAEVLELRDVATPTPKGDEVLVRVHAASVNDWDWALLRGRPRGAGKLGPVIDRSFQLAEVPEAFRLFGTGDHKGKIIVTMAGG